MIHTILAKLLSEQNPTIHLIPLNNLTDDDDDDDKFLCNLTTLVLVSAFKN